MNKNFFITMSGGTTQVINATLVGMIRSVREYYPESKIYAGYPGIVGALEGTVVDLTDLSSAELERLYRTPGSGYIGTTRVSILNEGEMAQLDRVLEQLEVGFYLNIGGSGTIKQTIAIQEALGDRYGMVALPKTVDNDFGDVGFTDLYFTPGFPSCAKYWKHKTHLMNFENLGAYSHDTVVVAQTFGRKTGFLAACARLADPERKMPLLILLPEDQKSLAALFTKIQETVAAEGRALIVMSEGYEIGEYEKKLDPSGQVMYGSSESTSAQLLVNYCMANGVNARAFIPGYDQRSEVNATSTIDLETAYGVGCFAIKELSKGGRGFFASVCRSEDGLNGIGFKKIGLDRVDTTARVMPREWIDGGNYDVTDAFVAYASGLIGIGEVNFPSGSEGDYFALPRKPMKL